MVQLAFVVALLNEHVEHVLLFEFPQVLVGASNHPRVDDSRVHLDPDLQAVLVAVIRHLEWHFHEAVASFAIARVANSLDHQHSILLLIGVLRVDVAEVLRQVPRRTVDLMLDELGYLLLREVPLLLQVLVACIAYLACFGDAPNSVAKEDVLTVASAFVLTDALWCDQGLDLLV